jgi:inner membrane protein
MKAFNHVAGGFVFTGLFASMADQNIFQDIPSTLTVLAFSQLPDIDHQKSLIGKIFPPISKYLQRNFGHRTITHSVFALFLVIVLMRLIDFAFSCNLTLFASLSFASHLIFDMCTRAGIQFFYPFTKKPAVLPANPNLRLQTNDLRSEMIVFSIFICLNFTMLPLFASGFWTKYNNFFMTFDHMIRETKEKPGLYFVEFLDQEKTEKAILIEGNEKKIIVLENRKLKEVETEKLKLQKFAKIKLEKKKIELNQSGITFENLQKFKTKLFLKGIIQSNKEFIVMEKTIQKTVKFYEFKFDFPDIRKMEEIDTTNIEIQKLEIQKKVKLKEFENLKRKFDQQKQILQKQLTKGNSNLEILKNTEIQKSLEILEIQKPQIPDFSILDFQIFTIKSKSKENQLFNISFETIVLNRDTSKP